MNLYTKHNGKIEKITTTSSQDKMIEILNNQKAFKIQLKKELGIDYKGPILAVFK